jgi:hypothetical protein
MKLVLREYLSMLKESGELDALLPDLLLAMGVEPLSRPGSGPRQFGVDLPAVGIDEDGRQKLFLVTIKRGDLSRNDWNAGKQSVRPSLDEILDSYLRTRVRPEHEPLPKKIILATGGELKQDVAPDWDNYVHTNRNRYPQYGEIEFDFWGGDKLAALIERHILDEYLFPESAQKQIRKTIALSDQNEDEPRHFYAFVDEILFGRNLPKEKTAGAQRQRRKALRLLNLSLDVVFHWCAEADNLRPALFCAERTVLRTWDWMRQRDLFECRATHEEFARLFDTYLTITARYADKLAPYCVVRDGLFGQGADEVEYPLRVFEVIGILGLLVVAIGEVAGSIPDGPERTAALAEASGVASSLVALINHNPAAFTPSYDGHAIDIALGLLALTVVGAAASGAEWVRALSGRIALAYQVGRHFPISSDSFEDLVAVRFGQAPPKQTLMELSTLLPMLAEWHAVLDIPEDYQVFRQMVTTVFPDTNLQLWYPDSVTDGDLYSSNAGVETGATLSSIELPATLSHLRQRMLKIRRGQGAAASLSCVVQGWPVLGLLASRHFRTPVIPAYWQQLIPHADSPGADLPAEDGPESALNVPESGTSGEDQELRGGVRDAHAPNTASGEV